MESILHKKGQECLFLTHVVPGRRGRRGRRHRVQHLGLLLGFPFPDTDFKRAKRWEEEEEFLSSFSFPGKEIYVVNGLFSSIPHLPSLTTEADDRKRIASLFSRERILEILVFSLFSAPPHNTRLFFTNSSGATYLSAHGGV